jgi:predicted ArsR family transcriptional regulator
MTAIETALEQLSSEIELRETARMALLKLIDVSPPLKLTIPEAENPMAPVPRKYKRKNQAARRSGEENLQACAKLSPPISAEDLAGALGTKVVSARGQLERWVKKKLVRKVGKGRYEMMLELPAAQAATPPPKREYRADLEEKIAAACKERDNAVASGRDKLAKILQDKVDKLQVQLDAA